MSEYVTIAEFEEFKKAVFAQIAGRQSSGEIIPASKEQCLGKWGDREIRFSSRYWEEKFGAPFESCTMSSLTPEQLRYHADYLIKGAPRKRQDPLKAKFAEYDLRDAALCLGWATLKESGYQVEPQGDPLEDVLF